jgi:hypothetical protein
VRRLSAVGRWRDVAGALRAMRGIGEAGAFCLASEAGCFSGFPNVAVARELACWVWEMGCRAEGTYRQA